MDSSKNRSNKSLYYEQLAVVKSAGDNVIFFKEALKKISIKNHSLNALKQPKKCFYVENSICIVRECEVGMYLFQARMNSF